MTREELSKRRTFALKLGGLVLGFGLSDAWVAFWIVPSMIDLHDSTVLALAVVVLVLVLIVNAWAVTTIWGMFLPKTPKD